MATSKKLFLVVDRVEGKWIVGELEGDGPRREINMPKSKIPTARDGRIYKSTNGGRTWTRNTAEEKKRMAEENLALTLLRKRDTGGDISL